MLTLKCYADQVLQRSISRGSRRGGRQNRNRAGSKQSADFKGHLAPAGAMSYHAQNGSFGRDFEHQHQQAAGGIAEEVHLNGDAHTPHSESSGSDRIAAYPSTTAIPTTTAGLQLLLVGIRGDIGWLQEVSVEECSSSGFALRALRGPGRGAHRLCIIWQTCGMLCAVLCVRTSTDDS